MYIYLENWTSEGNLKRNAIHVDIFFMICELFLLLIGLCGLSLRQEISSSVYLLKKEPEKEGDGVFQLLYGRQILP